MTTFRIPTDNPRVEQWKLLSRFYYPPNIRRYLTAKGLSDVEETVNYIAGSMRQSEGYFSAALLAPLDIAPLLTYYGATNLTSGAAALVTGARPNIDHHGMTMDIPAEPKSPIADYEITLSHRNSGAIQSFASVFDNIPYFHESRAWTIGEIFGSVPAVVNEFETAYPGRLPYCVPAKTVRDEMDGIEYLFDEIPMDLLAKYPDPYETIMSIARLKDAYIKPRINIPAESAKLYPKRDGSDIGIYSVFGEKYLPLTHKKNGRAVCPNQLVMMLMGLFALGYLSRYSPDIWNPFVLTDQSGERVVVERFLTHCQRFLPNLVLNEIEGRRIQFVFEVERDVVPA